MENNDISIQKCKATLTRFYKKKSHIQNYRYISENKPNSIFQFNTRYPDNTIIEHTGKAINSLIGWRLGITSLERLTMTKYDSNNNDYTCPLCKKLPIDPLQTHLLDDCTETKLIRKSFRDSLKSISVEHAQTFDKIHIPEGRLAWLLTAGESQVSDISRRNYDLPIIETDSLPEIEDKQNNNEAAEALKKYMQIREAINDETLRIYTDGSKIKTKAGSGYIIYKSDDVIHSNQKPLNNCEVDSAELYAIYIALKYVKHELRLREKERIHLFTDSRHALDALAEHTQNSRDHRILNRIQKCVQSLNIELILHWIPSHLEPKINGRKQRIEGNFIADSIAKQAAKSDEPSIDYAKTFIHIPNKITHICAKFTYAIDTKIYRNFRETQVSQNAGPSQDDFRLPDSQHSSQGRATS
jgi:ribonuclease HI